MTVRSTRSLENLGHLLYSSHPVATAAPHADVAVISSPEATLPAVTGRFALLDVVRALAASIVVLHHIPVESISRGHDAVMVFFVISGYCISAAAYRGMHARHSWRTMAFKRFRRIYPPYLASILITGALLGSKSATGFTPWHPSPWTLLRNVSLTQWTWLLKHPMPLASLNPQNLISPYWSLGYEEQFYVVMIVIACLTRGSSKRFILSIIVLLLAGFCIDLTVSREKCFGIFLEYWPHFSAGILVFFYLHLAASKKLRTSVLTATAVIFVTACLIDSRSHPSSLVRPLPHEFAIVYGTALSLIGLARFDGAASWFVLRPLLALGKISYSLYLMHFPWLGLVDRAARSISGRLNSPMVLLPLEFMGHIAIAYSFWWVCERHFLNSHESKPRPLARQLSVGAS